MTKLSSNKSLAASRRQYFFKQKYKTLRYASPMLILIGTLIFSSLTSWYRFGWQTYVADKVYLKYIQLLIMLFAVLLSALNLTPTRIADNLLQALKANWYLTLFFIMSFPGAYYARIVINQTTTYFSEAVMLLSFIGAYFIFISVPNRYWSQVRMWILKTFTILILIAAILVFANISRGIVHQLGKTDQNIVLLLMQGVALVYYFQTGIKKYWYLGVLTVLTVLTLKNSAILTFIIVCFLLYLYPSRFIRKMSVSSVVKLILAVALVLLMVVGGYLLLRSGYSDGNVNFRSTLYMYRFEEFLKSPITGHFFTGETAYTFEKIFGGASVATHSDIMDVLSQGGLIGVTLFVGIFVHSIFLLLKARHRMIYVDLVNFKLISWQLAFLISIIVLFLFNPLLGTPSIAFIIWVSMAFGHRLVNPLPF